MNYFNLNANNLWELHLYLPFVILPKQKKDVSQAFINGYKV